MTTRTALRAVTLTATVALLMVAGAPAFATTRDDGDQPGDLITVGQAIVILVGIPLLMFLVIALLVYAPGFTRGPRYRPGLGWWAAPVWFAGPQQAEEALANAEPTTDGGGASARW